MPRSRELSRLAGVVSLAAFALAACGGAGGTSATGTTLAVEESGGSPAQAETSAFPVTTENCGDTQTFEAPPERVVTMNQHVTEILLALGLEDRMVGTAYMDSEIEPELADAYASVEVLAEEYPSREQVLAVEPDLVVGGFASAFEGTAAGDRDELESLGIGTYLSETYCPDRDGPASLRLVEADLRALGAIFGVSARAERLIGDITDTVGEVRDAVSGAERVEVFVYDSGHDRAFTAAGFEMTTQLIDLAGGRNVFEDVEATFTEVSWEDVVDRQPDVVVILDYGGTSVAEKQELLRTHPVASTLGAVKRERFVVLELTDVVPGTRNGEAVRTMAAGFHPDLVAE